MDTTPVVVTLEDCKNKMNEDQMKEKMALKKQLAVGIAEFIL